MRRETKLHFVWSMCSGVSSLTQPGRTLGPLRAISFQMCPRGDQPPSPCLDKAQMTIPPLFPWEGNTSEKVERKEKSHSCSSWSLSPGNHERVICSPGTAKVLKCLSTQVCGCFLGYDMRMAYLSKTISKPSPLKGQSFWWLSLRFQRHWTLRNHCRMWLIKTCDQDILYPILIRRGTLNCGGFDKPGSVLGRPVLL